MLQLDVQLAFLAVQSEKDPAPAQCAGCAQQMATPTTGPARPPSYKLNALPLRSVLHWPACDASLSLPPFPSSWALLLIVPCFRLSPLCPCPCPCSPACCWAAPMLVNLLVQHPPLIPHQHLASHICQHALLGTLHGRADPLLFLQSPQCKDVIWQRWLLYNLGYLLRLSPRLSFPGSLAWAFVTDIASSLLAAACVCAPSLTVAAAAAAAAAMNGPSQLPGCGKL